MNDSPAARARTLWRSQLASFLVSGATIDLPRSDGPVISVVVPVWNGPELTFGCLSALREVAGEVPFETVVVDDASTDATAALLARVTGATVLRSPLNEGFVGACNRGARASRGRHLLFLNNDARILPGSLAAALATLEGEPDVGAVGARVVLADGSLQEAGSVVGADGLCCGYGRGRPVDAPEAMVRREADFCSGVFLLTPRSLFDESGGFSSDFAPAYGEDVDYCLRLKRRGLRTLYEPGATVVHLEYGSAASTAQAHERMARARGVLLQRHGAFLGPRGPLPPRVPLSRRSPSRAPRVLMVEDRVPHPSLGAGYGRSLELLTGLLRAGCAVTLYPLLAADESWAETYAVVPRTVEVMRGLGVEGLAPFLAERGDDYAAVVVCRPHTMRHYLTAAGAAGLPRGRPHLVYDAEALYAHREALQVALAGGAPDPAPLEEELLLAREGDRVLAVSVPEAERFAEGGASRVQVLGHTVTPRPTPSPFATRRGFLFVGSCEAPDGPNADALGWFAAHVAPLLGSALGEGLSVVAASRGGRDLLGEGTLVATPGFVPDLTPLYDQARVFVAPTRFAAGIPIKVIEAQSRGLPCVVTDLLARGLGLRDGTDALVVPASDPGAFAEACLRLHGDERLWCALREAGLERTVRCHGREAFDAVLHGLAADLSPPPPPSPQFVVVGAQRAGTTSLLAWLGRHPRVRLPAQKELHFADLQWERGADWYRSLFPSLPPGCITGEASPYYLVHPLAPRRLALAAPEARIVVVLRDPAARALSHHRHACRHGLESLPLDRALEAEEARLAGEEEELVQESGYRSLAHQHHSYVARGLYLQQLRRWEEAFAADRIHCLLFEELLAHPARVLAGLLSFLGLPPADLGDLPHLNATEGARQAPGAEGAVLAGLRDRFRGPNEALAVHLGRRLPW